jgi:DNA-directed RNA polymerase subunit RPC12/RpoP
MAATLPISCPECGKQMQVRADLEGKKIRCKDCGQVFPVRSSAIKKPSAAPPARKAAAAPPAKAPARPARKQLRDDEEENQNPYEITETETSHRCPHCAAEFESEDAIICLSCGYNVETRDHIKIVKTVENTGSDQFLWLLPGILCVLAIFALIFLDLFWWLILPEMFEEDDPIQFIASAPITLWIVVMSLFGIFYAGRFAIRRLILNHTAPEKVK